MIFDIAALSHEETATARVLFSSVFDHLINAEQWEWKYALGPRLDSVNLVARTPAGELIGHIGCILFQGLFKGQPLVFAQVCDVMVSRHVRGGLNASGVYPQLIKALQHTLQERPGDVFAYGFPGVRPFKLGERMGFYRRLYPVQYSRFNQTNAGKRGFQTVTLFSGDWDCTRLDAIWKRLASSQDSPVVSRTGAYLLWRYLANPEHSYRLWIIKRFWKDVGWLVTSSLPNHEEVIIDSLLPSQVTINEACHLLWQRLKVMQSPAVSITHWLGVSTQSAQPNGIIATEFLVAAWHNHFPDPRFQPGDTDVF